MTTTKMKMTTKHWVRKTMAKETSRNPCVHNRNILSSAHAHDNILHSGSLSSLTMQKDYADLLDFFLPNCATSAGPGLVLVLPRVVRGDASGRGVGPFRWTVLWLKNLPPDLLSCVCRLYTDSVVLWWRCMPMRRVTSRTDASRATVITI